MSVVVDGYGLTLEEVVAVARDGAEVELAADVAGRMAQTRRIMERAVDAGEPVYGATTGVGALKRVAIHGAGAADFNRLMVLNCRVGQGPPAKHDVVRATLLRLVNGLARGVTGVRPLLADLVVRALNEDWQIDVRTIGSPGDADLAPMADLISGLLDREQLALAAGEGLALVDNTSFSTAVAALALADAFALADWLDGAAALDLEAFLATPSALHSILRERPYPGLQEVAARMRALLEGSALYEPGVARHLQDPLTFRCIPQIHGALRDALAHTAGQVAIELNAAHSNPLVDVDEERIVSVGCFESVALSAALDYLRIAFAPVLTSAAERTVKLLHAGHSGLPPGLAEEPEIGDDGYNEFGLAAQSLTAEARLLAAPVSFELVTSSQAEGIEDRMTMAPLSGRRLAEMLELGRSLVAVELVVAARAVDMRPGHRLGEGTAALHSLVRVCIPATTAGQPVPADMRPLTSLVGASSGPLVALWGAV